MEGSGLPDGARVDTGSAPSSVPLDTFHTLLTDPQFSYVCDTKTPTYVIDVINELKDVSAWPKAIKGKWPLLY